MPTLEKHYSSYNMEPPMEHCKVKIVPIPSAPENVSKKSTKYCNYNATFGILLGIIAFLLLAIFVVACIHVSRDSSVPTKSAPIKYAREAIPIPESKVFQDEFLVNLKERERKKEEQKEKQQELMGKIKKLGPSTSGNYGN